MIAADCDSPSNYYKRKYGQIAALWVSVIIRTMRDYVLWKKSEKPQQRREADSARSFLFDQDGGLEHLCSVFNLDPEKFRRRARTMTPEEIRKIERIERKRGVDIFDPTSYIDEEDSDDGDD